MFRLPAHAGTTGRSCEVPLLETFKKTSHFLGIFCFMKNAHVDDYNTRNKVLTANLLWQGYRYHKLRKAFSLFYRHFD